MDAVTKRVWPIVAGLVAAPAIGVVVAVTHWRSQAVSNASSSAAPTPQPARPAPLDDSAATRAIAHSAEPSVSALPAAEPPPEVSPKLRAQADELIARARSVQTHDPTEARRLLRKAVKIDPANRVALEQLALKTLLDENQEQARQFAQRCVKANQTSAQCERVLSMVPEPSPELEHLVRGMKVCSRETPHNPECNLAMVIHHLASGHETQAAMFAGKLKAVAPEWPGTHLALGRLAAQQGDYEKARARFETACQRGHGRDACFRASVLRSEGF